MPRSDKATRHLFDQWAETYAADVQQASGILSGYKESLQTAAEAVPVAENVALLDIGIGTGGFAELLEAQAAQVTGIDVSSKMLERCAELHPTYRLMDGGFDFIPLDDQTMDTVVSSFTFHEVPYAERPNALRGVYNVLKPGGVLCLLDVIFASTNALDEARVKLADQWDSDEEYSIVGDLDKWLREAGFNGMQWRQTAPCHWFVIARR